jgi:hypothetical protein
MNKDFDIDKVLCEKYPLIFADRNKSMQESCMFWGISTGPGWFNILDQLCSNIQWHIDAAKKSHESALKYNMMRRAAIRDDDWKPFKEYYNFIKTEEQLNRYKENLHKSKPRHLPELVPQVVADQVKEKYGTLRFYYSGGDSVIEGMVAMAEAMSAVTCDVCGNPGKETGGGWISTRCEEHKVKYPEHGE